jgi:hypothetical protein
MADYKNIPLGLRTQTQIPLDVKEYSNNESLLSNLGVNGQLAYTYTKGLVVYCIEESTRWEWTEVKPGLEDTGLINQDFIYSDNHIAFGIDYSNKRYNFFPYGQPDGSETKVTAGTNTTITGNGTIATPYVVNSTVTVTPQGIQDTIDTNNLINQAEIEIALNGGLYVYAIPPSTEIYGTLFAQYGSQGLNVVTAFIGTESSLGKSSLTFYTNKTQFIDSRFNKGIEYGGDYEANFTARSLITKQYLESQTNKQKIITYPADFTGTNYTVLTADNNYSILIDNGATDVTITVPTGLMIKIQIGFIQKGTGLVTFVESGTTLKYLTGRGLKMDGINANAYLEKDGSTEVFFFFGNIKA